MKKIISGLLLIVSLSASAQVNCTNLSTSFSSYDDAISKVRNSNFKFIERANTSRSSWIRDAAFYSCDKQYGFVIVETSQGNYIHFNVPLNVWYEFKRAHSFGTFYNTRIRNRYKLVLNN
jgi:hypothetical protein